MRSTLPQTERDRREAEHGIQQLSRRYNASDDRSRGTAWDGRVSVDDWYKPHPLRAPAAPRTRQPGEEVWRRREPERTRSAAPCRLSTERSSATRTSRAPSNHPPAARQGVTREMGPVDLCRKASLISSADAGVRLDVLFGVCRADRLESLLQPHQAIAATREHLVEHRVRERLELVRMAARARAQRVPDVRQILIVQTLESHTRHVTHGCHNHAIGWAVDAVLEGCALSSGEETAVEENPYAKGQLGKDLKFDHCRNAVSSAALQCHAMTAKDALAQAVAAPRGERLHLFGTICGPRGACRREMLTDDPGRWSWCPDCLTLFDDYGSPVNPITESAMMH